MKNQGATECVGYEGGKDGIWNESPFSSEHIVNILFFISSLSWRNEAAVFGTCLQKLCHNVLFNVVYVE